MRGLFLLCLLLLAAVGLGFLSQQDPGYVLMGYQHWTLETTLWAAVAAIIVVFCLLYFFIRLWKNIFSLPAWFARRKKLSQLERYQRRMTQGVTNLSVGNFSSAEKLFAKTNYLLAAQAAQAQAAYDRRDAYLQKAFDEAGHDTFAVSLVQGLYYLQMEQYDEALITLKPLYKKAPKNTRLLSALKTIYVKNRDWESLQLILPQLKKYKLISKEEISGLSIAQ